MSALVSVQGEGEDMGIDVHDCHLADKRDEPNHDKCHPERGK